MHLAPTTTLGSSLSIVAVVGMSAFAHSAHAQTQATAERALETIVVTARKREESMQAVPVSLTALTGAQLAESGVKSMTQLTQSAPSVYFVSYGAGQPQVAMRGNSNRVGGDPGVGFFTDGFFTAASTQFAHGPVDVARVEVLSGPQATVYGRNTIAGAINLISNDPTDTFEGSLSSGYGGSATDGDDLWHAQGLLSGPLTDTLSGRIVYEHKDQDGYLYDDTSGQRLGGSTMDYFRGRLKWTPSDTTTVKLTGEYEKNETARWEAIGYFATGVHPFAPNLPIDQLFFTGVSGSHWSIRTLPGQTEAGEAELTRGFLEVVHTTAIGDLTSQTSYGEARYTLQHDSDVTPFNLAYLVRRTDNDTFTQELRLTGNEAGWTWLGGVFYMQDKQFISDDARLGAQSRFAALGLARQYYETNQTTDSYAAFGQVGYQVTANLQTTIGARWSRDEKKSPFVGFNTLVTGATTPPINDVRDDSWDSLTYLASLNYTWTDAIMTYASYSTGFKAGGFQNAINAVAVSSYYDPETVEQIEVGLKSDLFDRRVRLNLSAYRSQYDDLQVNNFRILPNGPVQVIQNAAGALVYGADLEIKVLVGERLMLSVLESYIPTAKIEGFSSIADHPSIEGFRIPRTPKHSYTVALDYGVDVGADMKFKARAAYSQRNQFVNELDATQRPDGSFATVPLRGYGLLNVSAGVTRGQWSVDAFVRNVTNKGYFVAGTTAGTNTLPLLNPGEPRTWEATVTRRF